MQENGTNRATQTHLITGAPLISRSGRGAISLNNKRARLDMSLHVCSSDQALRRLVNRSRRRCTLSRLPGALLPHVHFFAFIAVSALLEQWLAHYENLGVDFAHRSRIIVHSASVPSPKRAGRGLAAALRLLRRHGVHARMSVNWSSATKTREAAEYLLSLPATAYLVYADADEFFQYPCALELLFSAGGAAAQPPQPFRAVVAISYFVERLPPTGAWSRAWSPKRPGNHSLSATFPRWCFIARCAHRLGTSVFPLTHTKFSLIPAVDLTRQRVQPVDAHQLGCGRAHEANATARCTFRLILPLTSLLHFRYTADLLSMTRRKADRYSQIALECQMRNATCTNERNAARKYEDELKSYQGLSAQASDGVSEADLSRYSSVCG